MSRLTEKTIGCFGYCLKDGSDSEVEYFKNYDAFYSHSMAIKKLGEYEDAEEQGLLIRVPSKKGDKVYRITQYTRETKEVFAGYDHLGAKWDIEYVYDYEIEEIKFDLSHVKEWNKSVFATKEEAEQKLAEMKGNNDEC